MTFDPMKNATTSMALAGGSLLEVSRPESEQLSDTQKSIAGLLGDNDADRANHGDRRGLLELRSPVAAEARAPYAAETADDFAINTLSLPSGEVWLDDGFGLQVNGFTDGSATLVQDAGDAVVVVGVPLVQDTDLGWADGGNDTPAPPGGNTTPDVGSSPTVTPGSGVNTPPDIDSAPTSTPGSGVNTTPDLGSSSTGIRGSWVNSDAAGGREGALNPVDLASTTSSNGASAGRADGSVAAAPFESQTAAEIASFQTSATLPTFTYPQIAAYLTDGYWNEVGWVRHSFATTTVTFNISALTAAGQALATAALELWSLATGLVFSLTTGSAQITFDDNQPNAYATASASGNTTVSAHVNISTAWLANYGSTIGTYGFQTYLHEIGHALGLGHAGNYNGTGGWAADGSGDNHYLNDSWQATVMSYFTQDENTSVNATFAYVVGPMIADYLAIQNLYGVPTTTYAGATTWGFNSTTASAYNFANYTQGNMVAFAIFDSGGVDTLDASGFSATQLIDMRAGNYSNIGGEVGNIGIAFGTVIENAIGGSGIDTIIGNDVANIINGGAGADSMSGGLGDDSYYVDNAGDVVTEGAGEGTDRVYASLNYTLTANVERLTLTGVGNINATGNALANTLDGNSGNNVLDGLAGADVMTGFGGDDTYYVDNAGDVVTEAAGEGTDRVYASLSYTLTANVERLTLTGTGNINATGNALANTLEGNSGNNVLDGGTGADTMAGGGGNDTYYVDNAGDVVTEAVGGGTDTVIASITYSLAGSEVEHLTLTGLANINATGNALANTLTGNGGNNILDGLAGADTMAGGAGNDTYYVDNAGDVVSEAADEGSDRVYASISYTLTGNVERLNLTGTGNINATGNSLANTIVGNSGNNTIDGGASSDSMYGGAGDDTYYVDNAGDRTYEDAGEGFDRVYSSVSFSVRGQSIERITLTGSASVNATGDVGADILDGNTGNNILDGGAGADTMAGGAGNDTYYVDDVGDTVTEAAGAGNDRVIASLSYTLTGNVERLTLAGTGNINATGNTLANTIVGNSGNNIIDGGASSDGMYGAAGDDTYYVDNAGDRVYENAGEGFDHVYASVTYTVRGQEIERITLTGTGSINATGGVGANIIEGNSGANIIDGGAGADTMSGGAGNDTYYVENVGDSVIESTGAGSDRVFSSISYTLTDNVEQLTLTGAANINATGNALANTIVGNTGNNVIDGGASSDSMYGGLGDDTYYVDNIGDRTYEDAGEGFDHVFASVNYSVRDQSIERVTLTGTANINATGGAGADTLEGNVGNNVLRGGAGNDVLFGGGGNDVFIFDSAITAANADTISDFVSGADRIQLDNAVMAALGGVGGLNVSMFWASSTGVAHDADDRVIYNTTTGQLLYDPDGNGAGAAIVIATLTGTPALTHSDIFVI